MSSYPEFAHLQIPLQKILSATDNFADENLIGRGGFGKVYKGKLFHSENWLNIAARRLDLDGSSGQNHVQFWTEISMLSRLSHKNIISIVGFCDEDDEKIIVNEYTDHMSLDKYLSDPTLTFLQRLCICVSAARALSYIHYDTGRNYCVIHRNVKSSKLLLDKNWEAKVCGFGLSITNPATRRHRLLVSEPCGTISYVDPAYVKTRTVTHKSDVYSFGIVLFEVLCGKRAFIRDAGRNIAFVVTITNHYEEGTLDEIIHPDIRKQMHPQSFQIVSDTAYICLNKQRSQRPAMDQIVKRLEKALEFQWKYDNPSIKEESLVATESTLSNYLKLKEKHLDHLMIPLSDIQSATENFSESYLIALGGFGAVYKAELKHFDVRNSLATGREIKDGLPRRFSIVAIKRILGRQDGLGEQGFYAEIEALSRCEHPNIVSLLGFCVEGGEMILVYEYASNGSLDECLTSTDNIINLTWAQRIKVCLEIAHGLKFLHTSHEGKEKIIHRDIKSANILLGKNWEAKIADFGLSKSQSLSQLASTIYTNVAGTSVYLDPEYKKTHILKKGSDVYSLGVVLFEIFCGRVAYDPIYMADNDRGLGPMARRGFEEKTIKKMLDPKILEEIDLKVYSLNRGPNQDSLDTFSKIAYECVAETQAGRPTMEVVIKELEKALYYQEFSKDNLKFSLEDIKSATQNFSDHNLVGQGGFGKIYRGELPHANGCIIIAAKRLDREFGQGEVQFMTELEILLEYKHENVIGFVGYCDEMDEKIIVYELASKGSLDKHLNNDCLSWMKRLNICIDIASALYFLHGGGETQDVVIHRDVKSSNILLNDHWKAKLTDFGLSLICQVNQEMDFLIEDVVGTLGYCDPQYISLGFLTKESDIYSFGVALTEILCGRLVYERNDENRSVFITSLFKQCYEEKRVNEMVFQGIVHEIDVQSMDLFSTIAYRCLKDTRDERPTAGEVLEHLKQALEFQEDREIWEPKLPKDYKDIIQLSTIPDIDSIEKKKDLYDVFSKGMLVQDGNLLLSLVSNGEINEMISARKFSYKNRESHKWRSIPESRFQIVAEILDILNLKIQIKTKAQFLSQNVVYGVYLVFKLRDPKNFISKPMYVNLKYKKGSKTLHAYLAKPRDDKWMMIELCRFLNQEENSVFKFQLESLSLSYCGNDAIYVEGIEFQTIANIKHKEVEESVEGKRDLESNSNMDQISGGD